MGKYLIRAYAGEGMPPDQVMSRFARAFYDNVPENMFMTAFYGVLDPETDLFSYVSAGHNPPLFCSNDTGEVTEIPILGICLGVDRDVDYEIMTKEFRPGDALLLYTDGATDAKENGIRLEIDGLQNLLRQASGSAGQIVNYLATSIWKFSSGKLPDDVALVVLKRMIAP
jgi:sigma-B regulation protein RsbU (phosphoserine phosphatase)